MIFWSLLVSDFQRSERKCTVHSFSCPWFNINVISVSKAVSKFGFQLATFVHLDEDKPRSSTEIRTLNTGFTRFTLLYRKLVLQSHLHVFGLYFYRFLSFGPFWSFAFCWCLFVVWLVFRTLNTFSVGRLRLPQRPRQPQPRQFPHLGCSVFP